MRCFSVHSSDVGAGQRRVQRQGCRAAARVRAEGRVPVGRRLLGLLQWDQWVTQIRKVLPAQDYPIVDLPLSHPMLTTQFMVREVPQIPNIGYFMRSGGDTSEQGARQHDAARPHHLGPRPDA